MEIFGEGEPDPTSVPYTALNLQNPALCAPVRLTLFIPWLYSAGQKLSRLDDYTTVGFPGKGDTANLDQAKQ